MGKIRNAIRQIRTDACSLAVKAQTGELTLTRSDRMLFVAMAVGTMLLFAACTAFGAGGDFFESIKTTFWDYYGKFAGLALIFALGAIVIGILWIMISPSSKGSATPIAWIKKVIICYILLMLIGGIFGVINQIVGDGKWGGESLK